MIKNILRDVNYFKDHGNDVDYSNSLYRLGKHLIHNNPHYQSIETDIYCNCVEVFDTYNRNLDSCLIHTDGTYHFDVIIDQELEDKLKQAGFKEFKND